METQNVPQAAPIVKLNLGAGNTSLPGFENWDLKQGKQAFPLALPDGSVDEIYASHILEHFPRAKSLDVLREWVRVLKPGGRIRIAVPDMDKIITSYGRKDKVRFRLTDGTEKIADAPWEAWLFGGQTDAFDIHYTGWNRDKLGRAMAAVGLVDISDWQAEIADCAKLPISTNLQGLKRELAGDKPEPPQVEEPEQPINPQSPPPDQLAEAELGRRAAARAARAEHKIGLAMEEDGLNPVVEREGKIYPFIPASKPPAELRPWAYARCEKCGSMLKAHEFNTRRKVWVFSCQSCSHNFALTVEEIDHPPQVNPRSPASSLTIAAVTSMPRFGPSQMMTSLYNSLPGVVENVMHGLGPLWGQCLERTMEDALAKWDPDLLLVMDFDGVFGRADLLELVALMEVNDDVAALAAHQWNRGKDRPLWTVEGRSWDGPNPVRAEELQGHVIFDVATANFGLTLLRTSILKSLPHPWFLSQPNGENRWRDGKLDEDIYFWRRLRAAGHRVCIAPRVVIGHLELSIRWPGRNLETVWQHTSDFNNKGKPKNAFGAV